jgi:hypothetical protein
MKRREFITLLRGAAADNSLPPSLLYFANREVAS